METDFILLVEDNEDDVALLKHALEHAGIRSPMHWVQTTEAAINYLAGEGIYADRSLYPIPGIVFVDLKLPGQSGHDLLKWLNMRSDLAEIIRIVLTGSNDPADRKIALNSAQTLISKNRLPPSN